MIDPTQPLAPIVFGSSDHRALLAKFWTQHCLTCHGAIDDPVPSQRYCSNRCMRAAFNNRTPPSRRDPAIYKAAARIKQERRAA